MHSEATFAALCDISPIEASSGKTRLRRLNRGGDRRANAALYRIALTRSRGEHRTRDYLERRATQGLTRREAVRCLKRYIAREIYQLIHHINTAQLHEQLDKPRGIGAASTTRRCERRRLAPRLWTGISLIPIRRAPSSKNARSRIDSRHCPDRRWHGCVTYVSKAPAEFPGHASWWRTR
jgi:hypothetical protein